MTNVKLKLTFVLLNALLTVDIGLTRSLVRRDVNSTDIVIKFDNNSTFLPVDSNSDTLIVADEENTEHPRETSAEMNEKSKKFMEAILNAEQNRDDHLSVKVMKERKDETPEETEKSSNTHMENIMNAEQDRDEDINMKVMGDHTNEHQDDKETNKHLEQIMNAEQDRDSDLSKKNTPVQGAKVLELPVEDESLKKSPLIEKFIDAERDRDDTFTDIHSKPESEFAEAPKFEFLIATKVNETGHVNKSAHRKSGKDVNGLELVEGNGSDVRKVDYVELVEVLKPPGANSSAYNLANITGHEVDNDIAPDTRFTDVQTLFLACFATLVPLLSVLFTTLLIRCMCRRWCPRWCKKATASETDSSDKEDDDQDQLKSPDDDGSGSAEVADDEGAHSNGSIFTMTLKNNHLIVETEERNDIAKNGRETKMKYSPDNEGIFVVEVQQGTAYRPTNKVAQISPPIDPQISTNQALIHRVPEEDGEKSTELIEKDRALALSSTGLSISDLSMSSAGSQHASYSYGSQMGYEQGPFGYPLYAGYDINQVDDGIIHDNSQEPLISKTPTDPDKPVVTAAIFKQDSIIGNEGLQGPGYCIEGSTDGPLLSDVQAREVSLQHLHDQKEKKLENGVALHVKEKIESPKKVLSRADSLPLTLEDEKTPCSRTAKDSAMETIEEANSKEITIFPTDAMKGKRASLPIIRTEVYESVKEAIRPLGSPKFDKLNNESSPAEEILYDQPPLITITEEIDPAKLDGSS